MDGPGKHSGSISGRLPQHKPNPELWGRISSGISVSPMSVWADKLPQHKANANAWKSIGKQLPASWYSWQNPYLRGAVILLLLLIVPPMFIGREKESMVEPKEVSHREVSIQDPNAEEHILIPENAAQPHTSMDLNNNQPPPQQIASVSTGEPSEPEKLKEVDAFVGLEPIIESSPAESSKEIASTNFAEEVHIVDANISRPNLRQLPTMHVNGISLKSNSTQNISDHMMQRGDQNTFASFYPKTTFETGVYFQPGFVKNISSINDQWYYTATAGVSFTMCRKHFLLETGINYNWVEFEDHLELDYYEYEFLGTIISTERYIIENYIDELGHTQTRKKYIVELIDIYDSTFQEEEQTGQVKMAGVGIPLSIGYRINNGGRFYADLKTGLDMMIISKINLSHSQPDGEITRLLAIQNNLPEKHNVKWKYHLALGLGYRIGGKLSIYLQPTAWWYLEGMSNRGTSEYKKPFEAGVQIGLRWEF